MITRRNVFAGALALGAIGLPRDALAESKIIRVPLTLNKHKPEVEVTIGGKGPYKFILDTGASTTVIRANLARELGLTPVGRGKAYSIKGSETLNVYRVPEIVVGGNLHLHKWMIVDSRGVESSGHDGLLPADILTRFQCQLDHRAGEIRYYINRPMDLSGFGPLNSFYKSGLRGESNKVHLKLTFPEHALDCVLDTGSGPPLYIRGDYVKANGLWDKYPIISESKIKGVNGKTVKTRIVEIKDFQVGGIWVPRMAVTLADPEDREAYSREGIAPGLIGAPFLSAFVLAFAADRKVYVKSSGSFTELAPPQKRASNAPESTEQRPIIPFSLGDDRRLVFPVQFGGLKIPALLVFGSGSSEIGALLAEKMELPRLAGGGFDASKLAFGGMAIPGQVLMPAGNAKSLIRLGSDFLRREPCALNLDDNYMTLYRSGGPDTAGYDAVPVTYDASGRPSVPARIAGRDMRLRLDTGSGYGVILTPEAVKRHELWNAFAGAEDRLTNGDGGAMTKIRYAIVKGLEFGAYRIDPAPVTMSNPEDTPDPEDDAIDGVIGIGVLWRFNMIFADGGVWFQPNKRFDRNADSRPAA